MCTKYHSVRRVTESLCRPLLTEDYVIQSMTDVSPPKWHLGHTTWFFEQLVLHRYAPHYEPYHERYSFIFNSYYQSLVERVSRDARAARPVGPTHQTFLKCLAMLGSGQGALTCPIQAIDKNGALWENTTGSS